MERRDDAPSDSFGVVAFARAVSAIRGAPSKALNGHERVVLIMLISRLNNHSRTAFPSIATLAADCGLSQGACRRNTRSLEAHGFLLIERRVRESGADGSHVYRIGPALEDLLSGREASTVEGGSAMAEGSTVEGVPPRQPGASTTAGGTPPPRQGEGSVVEDKLIHLTLPDELAKTKRAKRVGVSSSQKATGAIEIVHAHYVAAWRRHIGGTNPPMLDAKRRKAIGARLKDFPVETLKAACDGVFLSPWHMGENDRNMRYIDLALVCRDAEQVEKFAGMTYVADTATSCPAHREKSNAEVYAPPKRAPLSPAALAAASDGPEWTKPSAVYVPAPPEAVAALEALMKPRKGDIAAAVLAEGRIDTEVAE